MSINLTLSEAAQEKVAIIAVVASGGQCTDSQQPLDCLNEAMSQIRKQGITDERKTAVRQMLKFGKYRASGRGKPASEYLIGAAQKESLGGINNLVDINNTISLAYCLPASIFDGEKLGAEVHIRHGEVDESYVFNHAGHEIDLRDLLCVCRKQEDGWQPCGNPVKDAMITKVAAGTTTAVVAIVYAPKSLESIELDEIAAHYGTLLEAHGGMTVQQTLIQN